MEINNTAFAAINNLNVLGDIDTCLDHTSAIFDNNGYTGLRYATCGNQVKVWDTDNECVTHFATTNSAQKHIDSFATTHKLTGITQINKV